MPLCKWEDKDWDRLLYRIQRGNCILMLGPGTAVRYVDGKSVLLSTLLAQQLTWDMEPQYKDQIGSDNLMEAAQYCLNLGRDKIDLQMEARNFYFKYQPSAPGSFHQDLAALPFYLTILSTPDEMFASALRQHGKNFKTGWYNFRKKKSFMDSFDTKAEPLLFYLYGTIKEEESLVVTENDLLDFLVSITAEESLPKSLTNELKNKEKSFLFLGFGFKHWYLRILLHVLEIRNKANRSFALEDFTPRSEAEFESTVFFFQEGPCKIHFFEKGFDEFAAELRTRYEAKPSSTAPAEIPFHEEKRPKVFICHASEDKAFAASMYDQLKTAGLDPWLDKENIEGGDRWGDVIKKAIKKEIDYFLVLQSKALQKKTMGYVNTEIYEARERQKYFRGGFFIIPLVIDEGGRLEELEGLQSFPVYDAEHIAKLAQFIRRDFEKRGQ